MAHAIENNQFAYKGLPAWHGLGTEVSADATGQEMLSAAHLDWTVKRRQLAMRSAMQGDSRMLTEELSGFRAIVRTDTDHVFQIASDRYQPVQNREIVDFFREFCEAGHASMETVGALRDGAVVWALAKLNGGTSATLPGGDELRGYMMLATSHDGSLKTIGKPTQVRVVCGNTLAMAMGDGKASYSLKHSSKFSESQRNEAKRVMGMASESIIRTNELCAKLAGVSVDQGDWMEFMGKLLGPENVLLPETAELSRIAAEIQEATMTSPGSNLESARGTLWGAVNGISYYTDHVARARSDSNRLFSAWFGDGSQMKAKALQVAAEMAGIQTR
jgi:phage/plasmid-like protein (TIGR03299 family)